MIEVRPIPSDTTILSQSIADNISTWTYQECITSLNDRNQYLDKLEEGQNWLSMEYDNPANMLAAKHTSHHNRQRLWGEMFILEPDNDYATARHIFNGLMQISGIAKRMCYLAATDQAHYLELKKSPLVIGIDTYSGVSSAVQEATLEDTDLLLVNDAPEMQTATMKRFKEIGGDLDVLRADIEQDFGQTESPSMQALRRVQAKWVDLVTGDILSAMAYREGHLSKVPVLEPKSISDEPLVMYPFSQAA